ncbi:hypothetical protein MBANPS3_012456, partial [Mucor bainieri]
MPAVSQIDETMYDKDINCQKLNITMHESEARGAFSYMDIVDSEEAIAPGNEDQSPSAQFSIRERLTNICYQQCPCKCYLAVLDFLLTDTITFHSFARSILRSCCSLKYKTHTVLVHDGPYASKSCGIDAQANIWGACGMVWRKIGLDQRRWEQWAGSLAGDPVHVKSAQTFFAWLFEPDYLVTYLPNYIVLVGQLMLDLECRSGMFAIRGSSPYGYMPTSHCSAPTRFYTDLDTVSYLEDPTHFDPANPQHMMEELTEMMGRHLGSYGHQWLEDLARAGCSTDAIKKWARSFLYEATDEDFKHTTKLELQDRIS